MSSAGLTVQHPAPLVSILIACFNQAHYLAHAIGSALAQTAGPFEVIVVDDGSSDDPAAVVARFPGVRLIRQRNQGLSGARNTGWRAAQGRYVVFLDADDRLLPGALEVNLLSFQQNPDAACVHGAYCRIDAAGQLIGLPVPNSIGDDVYGTFLRGNRIGMHATVMYRRDRLGELGGFDVTLRACEDYDLYLRLARIHRIVSSPEIIAEYRQHRDNMSRNNPRMLSVVLSVLRRQETHTAGNSGWTRALAVGRRHVKALYVEMQMWQLRYGGRAALPDAAQVFMLAPGTFLAAVFQTIVQSTGKGCKRAFRRSK